VPDRARGGVHVRGLLSASSRRGRGHRPGRPGRCRRPAHPAAVGRAASPRGRRARAGRRPGAPLPRRADHRLRPVGAASGLGDGSGRRRPDGAREPGGRAAEPRGCLPGADQRRGRGAGRMSGLTPALRQVRHENRAFWRNPIAAFFTFFFPLMFMIIFNVLFGGTSRIAPGVRVADFYTPAVIVFGVITATYTNIAMMITAARDLGILKRMRGTPLPPWAFMAG